MANKVNLKTTVPGVTAEEVNSTEEKVTPILPSAKKGEKKQVNPFTQAAGEIRKERIANGTELDPNVINANAAKAPKSYEGIEKYHEDLPSNYYDAFEDYINPHTLKGRAYDFNELQKMRFENQTLGQEAGHAVARIATNIVPQIIGGFASMVDIPGYWDAEHAANNELVNWAANVKEKADQEWFPIYTDPNGGPMDIDSSAWWFANGSGLVESVLAFGAQGAGIAKGVSWGLKGLGAVSRGKDLARMVLGAQKSKNLLGATQTLTTATMLNQAEAVIEASQVYKDIYEKGINANLSPEEAKRRAADGAATTMNLNRTNILLNLTSAKAFLTPIKSTRRLLEAGGFGKAVSEVIKEGSQEALEETINFIASKTGTAVGEGKHKRNNIGDDFVAAMQHVKDAGSMEGLEAAFLGALGGMGQTGITSALKSSKYGPGNTTDEEGNRISANAAEKIEYEKQQAVIQDMKETGVRMTDTLMDVNDRILWVEKLNKANAEGNFEEVEKLKNQMFEEQALKAFQSGTTEILQDLYEHEASMDPNVVGADYVARAKQAVKDLQELEEVYNNAEEFENVDEVFKNRASKIRIDRATNDVENLKKDADLQLSKDVNTIAQKYKFEREQEILFKKEGVVERTETRKTEVPLTYSMSNLEENPGDSEHNKAVYNKFLEEVKSLDSFATVNEYEQQLEKLKETSIQNSKDYKDITSKAHQEKVARQKENKAKSKEIAEQIQSATSISEVERLSRMSADPAVKESAKIKLAELQKAAEAEAKNKKTSAEVQKFNSRISALTDPVELNKLREEINKAELSQKNKDALNSAIDTRIGRLTGEITDEEAAEQEQENGINLGNFDSRTPEEIAAEIAENEKNVKTGIPKDLPDPATEKESVENQVADAAKKLLESDDTKVVGTDGNGNLVYNYGRPENAEDRGAFLSREFNQSEDVGIVNREEITNTIENLQVLDPDFLTEGTELTMEIDAEYEGDKYDPASNTRQRTPWSLRLEQLQKEAAAKGVPLASLPEYIAEVPIKVMVNGQTVFYVHDNAWYRAENLNNSPEGIAQNKAFNLKIREKVIKSGRVTTKVTYKSFGKLFKTFDGKAVSVNEAMPDPNLILGVGRNGTIELGGNVSSVLGKNQSLIPINAQEGRLYAIVRVGPNTYMPIPLQKKPISQEVVDSIIFAIEAHLSGDPENGVVKAIGLSGIDITTTAGLSQYLSQFIYLYNTDKAEGLNNILMSQGGTLSTLKSERPLIAVTATGIEFGRPGVKAGNHTDGTPYYSHQISRNFERTQKGQEENRRKLRDKLLPILSNGLILSNANKDRLERGKNCTIILSAEGESRTIPYSEQVKESHQTNVLSINIGTDAQPKWVYTIQPTITFDTSFAGDMPKQTAVRQKPPIVTPTPRPNTTSPLHHPGVNPTVDLIVTRTVNGEQQVLLIRRGDNAQTEAGKLAFPGGFHDTNAKAGQPWTQGKETAKQAALRELKEETGLDLTQSSMNLPMPEVGVFDSQERDPRNSTESWTSATVFRIDLPADFDIATDVSGQDDAKEARWIPVSELNSIDRAQFGFDHANILETQGLKTVSTQETQEVDKQNPTNWAVGDEITIVTNARRVSKSKGTIVNIFAAGPQGPYTLIYKDNNGEQKQIDNIDNKGGFEQPYDADNGIFRSIYLSQKAAAPAAEPTVETEVEELTGQARIDDFAEQILQNFTLDQAEAYLDNLEKNLIPDTEFIGPDQFSSVEERLEGFKRAVELGRERAQNKRTITLPDGTKIIVDGNTQDSNSVGEDQIDDSIIPMTEAQIEAQRTEVDNLVIRGISSDTQSSLIAYIASTIMKETLASKEVGGKKTVKVAPIFAKHLKAFTELKAAYEELGLKNNAAKMQAIIDQFEKVKRLTNQHMALFTIGNVSEDLNLDDSAEVSGGLEKVVYTDDWAFSVNYKSTSSVDLKKFFTGIQAQDENGPISNPLGWPEMMPYDTVTDTCHEILANKPADYKTMMNILELNVAKFPWLRSVIDTLKTAPDRIKNEFVSDMAKHHVDMVFVMWSKDKNGLYSLQKWSSNATATEQRLRAIWDSNLRGVERQSNLIAVNANGDYVFDKTVARTLINQAAEFAKDPTKVTNEELAIWLGNFGIVITDQTYDDLREGKFNNQGKRSWADLFVHGSGLVKVLAKQLQLKVDSEVLVEDAELLSDSAVKALSRLDAANVLNIHSNSFQAGGKTVYSYGNNNFFVNRMRDLTAFDNETKTFINSDLIDGLKEISFTRDSLWLEELTDLEELGDVTRNTLSSGYLSLEALKKKYSPSQDNRKLNKLTPAEHEVTKLGLFFNTSKINLNKERRRKVAFFHPTMSDKSTMTIIQALSREVKFNNGKLDKFCLELLFKAMVTPEVARIRGKQTTNLKGYEPNYFYLVPGLNELMITLDGNEVSYLDIVIDKNDTINRPEVKQAVLDYLSDMFNILTEEKLEGWKSLGIGQTLKDSKGRIIDKFAFLDKEYMANITEGVGEEKVKYAARDFVFNYLIANAEAMKLFVGDPAMYAKFKSKEKWGKDLSDAQVLRLNLEETFTNMGKRLAGNIAPGLELANSQHNKYYQVFLEDKEINSENVRDAAQKEYFSKVIKDFAKNFSKIEGSDAQEYTTWKEHLYVMQQLGRLTQAQVDMLTEKLTAQSNGDFREKNMLSFDELGLVMQPIKPVYVGNVMDVADNLDRRVYIKSSSFPLLPQLTQGMQIDKIRQAIEKFETQVGTKATADGTPAFVRASFNTANKVGAVKKAVPVFDDNGDVLDNIDITEANTLLLPRSNFRIQQDVPYKREKDEINIGTQERALLFGDLLGLKISKDVTAEELFDTYNKNYEEIFKYNQEKLAEKLGLRETVTTTPNLESIAVLPETEVFGKVAEFNEKLKTATPIKKISLQEDLAEEIGEDTLERVNFINDNFDNIIKAIAAAKMNIFFDENQEFKKC
jgi:ADP-ribose pyrophosphatase YjhB (NUDIX family)